jgi:UDP-glucose 4-epimerase
MPEVVGLLGSTGFVGRAVAADLRRRGIAVRPVTAPRLWWPADLRYEVDALPAGSHPDLVKRLAEQLAGASVVVNAAGVPDGNAAASPSLYGANALLPVLVARASGLAGADRLIHLSTAAVQGGQPLDETARTAPFSPYSRSKALGERLLLAEPQIGRVVFRPTWVHDLGRPHTRALVRLAGSRAACVAGDGSAPTPQVLVSDVAGSVAQLVLARGPVPPIVLQPSNGMTTGLLLRLLGGREPHHIPHKTVRVLVGALRGYGRLGRHANAHARRVDMLLFGRPQAPGWLAAQGVAPALRPEVWQRLAQVDLVAGRV